MRVFITGATGLIGRRLVRDRLERGDEVVALTRSARRAAAILPDAPEQLSIVEGDPAAGGDWQSSVDGCGAAVHLAGAGVADRRWSEASKRLIVASRIESTARLVEAMEQAARRPEVFVCASATGYYGEGGEELLDETAPAGDDFLARLASAWEAQARHAERADVRVVSLRIGVVLDERGGALAKMVPVFRMFLGGPLGGGRAYVPWIHHRDVTGLIDLAIRDASLTGPLNVVAPNPVTGRALARALGAALGRPSWLPAPRWALRIVLGEIASYATMSQRVVPARAVEHGYRFEYTMMAPALASLLHGPAEDDIEPR